MNDLIQQCARVVQASEQLRVDPDAVGDFAASAPEALLALPAWDDPGMFRGSPSQGVAWLLAYNAINYCYWPDAGPRWSTVVDGRRVGDDDEALGIMTAFAAALGRGVPLDSGAWLCGLEAEELDRLLAPAPGAGALPLMDWRLAALHELGGAWVDHGGPAGLFAAADGSAARLVEVLVEVCPSWEDTRSWNGELLRFRKRAQLCAAMIHGWLGGGLADVERLTAFADYRLPQVLCGAGILRLEPELSDRIAREEPIPVGAPEEVAIRAATVYAAELLRQAFASRRPGVDALVVDHLLWRTAVARQRELPPFHRTRTTDY